MTLAAFAAERRRLLQQYVSISCPPRRRIWIVTRLLLTGQTDSPTVSQTLMHCE